MTEAETTETSRPAYSDTPIDYRISDTDYGQIDITVEDGESIADVQANDADAIVMLRLSRTEIAELIASLAKAMAALN